MAGPDHKFSGAIVFGDGLPPATPDQPGPGIGKVAGFNPSNPPAWAEVPASIILDPETGSVWINEGTEGSPDFVELAGQSNLITLNSENGSQKAQLPEIKGNGTKAIRLVQTGGIALSEVRPYDGQGLDGQTDAVLLVSAGDRWFLVPDNSAKTWWIYPDASGSLNQIPTAA